MDSTTVPHIDLSNFTEPLILSDKWYEYTLYMNENRLMIHVKCNARNSHITKARPINISIPDGIDYALDFKWCFAGHRHIRDISALSSIDSSKIISTQLMFHGLWNLKDLSPLSSWDVSNIHNMSGMFWGCMDLTDLTPLSSWNLPEDCNLTGFYSRWGYIADYPNQPPLPWREQHRRYNRQLAPQWLIERYNNWGH